VVERGGGGVDHEHTAVEEHDDGELLPGGGGAREFWRGCGLQANDKSIM